MLTNEQLIEARKRAEKWLTMGSAGKDTGTYVLVLLDHIETLTTHNRVMQVALAQFSDGDNWHHTYETVYRNQQQPSYVWDTAIDPIELAERALVGSVVEP